jgi:hypothetical protein
MELLSCVNVEARRWLAKSKTNRSNQMPVSDLQLAGLVSKTMTEYDHSETNG